MPDLSEFPQTSDADFQRVLKLASHFAKESREELAHLTFMLISCFKDGALNRERLLLLHAVLEGVADPESAGPDTEAPS